MILRHLGQHLSNHVLIVFRRDYPHVFLWYDWEKTLVSELQQRLTATQHINELFGAIQRAHGIETATNAARHYHKMIVVCHNI
jgi:hypothetical protein